MLGFPAIEHFHHPGHRKYADDAEQIQPEQHQPLQSEQSGDLGFRNEGADKQRVDRQPRRAGGQWRHHDGGQAVARILDRPRGHDAGNGTGITGQQGNERASRQSAQEHEAVEQECRTRQITGFFQRQDEGEQDQDLRQELQHGAQAGQQAIL